jgi:hypothetical protein
MVILVRKQKQYWGWAEGCLRYINHNGQPAKLESPG